MTAYFTVAAKEIKELLRDKATLILFIIPIMVFPFLKTGFSYWNASRPPKANAVILSDNPTSETYFMTYLRYHCPSVSLINTDNPAEALKEGDLDCVIRIERLDFIFQCNKSSFRSLSTTTRIGEGFEQFCQTDQKGLFSDSYKITLRDQNGNHIATEQLIENCFAPVVLLICVIQAVCSFASNLFAGEKERGTLEMLLLATKKRSAIYVGKLLALSVLSCAELFVCLLPYCFTFSPAFEKIPQTIFCLFLLCFFVCAATLSISMMSSTMRTAQMLNEIFSVSVFSIAVLITLDIIRLNQIGQFIPMINLLYGICSPMNNHRHTSTYILYCLTTLSSIALITCCSVRYMNSEKLLKK